MTPQLQCLACSLLAATSLTSRSRPPIWSASAGRVASSDTEPLGAPTKGSEAADMHFHGDEGGREDDDDEDMYTSARPSPALSYAHTEDLTTDELLDLLELRADSPFWRPIADGLAADMVRERRKEWDLNANVTNAASADGLPSSLADVSERMADLHQEHALVRHALKKALRPMSFEQEKVNLLQCAREMIGMWGEETIADEVAGPETVSESNKENDTVEPPTPETEAVAASADAVSGTAQGNSVLSDIVDSAAKEIKNLKRDLADFADFFVNYLRWELQIKIFGDLSMMFEMPRLAFKCQPLFECVSRIVSLPEAFIKVMSSLTRVIGEGLRALVRSFGRYLGVSSSSPNSRPKSTDEALHEAGVDIKIDLPAVRQGELHDQQKSTTKIEQHNSVLFDDYKRTAGQCQFCQGRLKGLFDFDIVSVLSSLTLPFSHILKLWVTTVPRPLGQELTKCLGCLKHHKDVLSDFFSKKSVSATKQYFRLGQCNAHTIGLCMILEKTRACRVTLDASGAVNMDNSVEMSGHHAQKDFCDEFKGMTLRLTQAGHKGITCPERDRQEVLRRKGVALHFEERNVSRLDFHMGCHMVRRSLKKYNVACERDFDPDTGPRFRPFSKLKRTLADATGNFKYEHVREPFSMKNVADKCRTIFDCRDQAGSQSSSSTDNRVNWRQLQSSIRGIVSQVDDFQGKPQSYAPQEATTEIVYLVKHAMNSLDQFQDDVTKKALAYEKDTEWGPSFENVFMSAIWDDRCFEGLNAEIDQIRDDARQKDSSREPSGHWRALVGKILPPNKSKENASSTETPLKAVYKRLSRAVNAEPVKEGMQFHDAHRYDFFHRFASEIGHRRWTEDHRCELDHTPVENPHQNQSTPRSPGAKIDLLVVTNISWWKQNWEDGRVDMETFDFSENSGLRHIELIRVGRDGCMGPKCTDGDWYLKNCVGSSCGGAKQGAVLVKMTIKGRQNNAVSEYLETSSRFLATMEKMESLLLHGGDEAEKRGLSSAGNVNFKEAVMVLRNWREDVCSKLAQEEEIWEMGAAVEVRNHEDQKWVIGRVSSTSPLLIDYENEDGQRLRDKFYQVRRKREFQVGNMVQVRRKNDKSWRDGKVASLKPLKVLEEGRLIAQEYHEVRHKLDCSQSQLRHRNGGSALLESSVLVELESKLQSSQELQEFFKTRRWSLQNAGTDKGTGKQLFRFKRNENPVRGLDELDDIIRLTMRPHLDAQRSVRSGIMEMGFDLIGKAPEIIIHGDDKNATSPTAHQPQEIPKENPFEKKLNRENGFEEEGDGLARVQLEFLNWEEQRRLRVYEKAFKLAFGDKAARTAALTVAGSTTTTAAHIDAVTTTTAAATTTLTQSTATWVTAALETATTTSAAAISNLAQRPPQQQDKKDRRRRRSKGETTTSSTTTMVRTRS